MVIGFTTSKEHCHAIDQILLEPHKLSKCSYFYTPPVLKALVVTDPI